MTRAVATERLSRVFVGSQTLGEGDDVTLSEDERARARRFLSDADRTRWVAGRAWLRSSLGAHLGVDPASIRFVYGWRGKPEIASPDCRAAFSFSHSGDRAMLAIGQVGTLGLDVERIRTGVYERDAAAIVLSREELEWVERGSERDARFLRCWVRKEAYGKALGSGLDPALRTITLTPTATESGDSLRVVDLDAPGVIASLAVPSGRRMTIEELGT